MSEVTISMIRARPVASAAIAIAVVGAATVLGAWLFQYGLGLKPCPLCLEQRYAYYFAIPLAVMVLLGDHVGASRKVLLAALIAITLGMLYNAGLGVYHSGIEWKWWAGPQECSGSLDDLAAPGGLLERLQSISVVRCDEAAWRFLGLSLAGYNALIYLASMQAIPFELYESAAMDGAGRFKQFRSITVPMLRPTILFTVIVSTIGSLQLFGEPLLFNTSQTPTSGGSQHQFQTMALYTYDQFWNNFKYGYGAAISWAMFGVILVIVAVNLLLARRLRGVDAS